MATKHRIRTKDGGTRTVTTSAIKAIRLNCDECGGWERVSVFKCAAKLCPLWPYRRGRTDKAEAAEALAAAKD